MCQRDYNVPSAVLFIIVLTGASWVGAGASWVGAEASWVGRY